MADRRQVAAAAPFTPTQIAGLKLWLKADGVLWQDSARTTPALLDGDPVGAWDDASGLGTHLTQATATKRGTLKLAIQNGRPVVRFDGVDDFLISGAAGVYAQPNTAVCAVRFTSGNRYLSGRVTATRLGNSTVFAGGVGLTLATAISGAHVSSTLLSGVSSAAWLDGAANGTGDPGTNGFDGFTAAAGEGGTAQWSVCDLCEVLVYNAALSTADRQACEAYLKARWGTP